MLGSGVALAGCGGGDSGGSEPLVKTDMDLLAESQSHVIDRPYRITASLTLAGKQILLKPGGSILIEGAAQLTLVNCDITAEFDINAADGSQRHGAFVLRSGSLAINDSRLDAVNAQGNVAPAGFEAQQAAPNLFIDGTAAASGLRSVVLQNNRIRALQRRFVALLHLADPALDPASDTQVAALRAELLGNYISGFHGVVRCDLAAAVRLERNTLEACSGTLAFLSGESLDIKSNRLLRAPDGAGSAIRTVGLVRKAVVSGNRFTGGDQPAVVLDGHTVVEVTLSSNHVDALPTHAVVCSRQTLAGGGQWAAVTLQGNLFTANQGAGICVQGPAAVTAQANHFQRNLAGYLYDLQADLDAEASATGNLYYDDVAEPLTLETLASYRNVARESNGMVHIVERAHSVTTQRLLAQHQLHIRPEGQITVQGQGGLTLANCDLQAEFNSNTQAVKCNALVLRQGSLLLTDCRVRAVNAPGNDAPASFPDQASPNLLINANADGTSARSVRLLNCSFVADLPEYIGLVNIGDETRVAIESTYIAPLELELATNYITGFQGVVMAKNLAAARIVGNTIERNNFAQVGISGENITVTDNRIIAPGNGRTGDGVSGLGLLRNCLIARNQIIDGSCYGIWLQCHTMTNVEMSGNYIDHGITHAVYCSHGSRTANWSSVVIADNIITRNVGGIAVQTANGCSVLNNHLQSNFKGFPHDVLLGFGNFDGISGNLYYDSNQTFIGPDNYTNYAAQAESDDSFMRFEGGWF